jgi:Fe-S cluster assembly protein SufD
MSAVTQWAAPLRAAAQQRAAVLPVKRDEYWRYTDPVALTGDLVAAHPDETADGFSSLNPITITFVDGVLDHMDAAKGVEISTLGDQPVWAQDLYGVLETRGQTPVLRPLAAQNTMNATQGVLIRVTDQVARPVSIIYINKSDTSDANLHHCIKIEAGAELTLLEQGSMGARGNSVLEVDLAEGGSFHHIRTQNHKGAALTHIFARLAANARFKSFTLTSNGRWTRNEAILELIGDGASAHVAGAALGDKDVHHDDTIFITHQGRACESRQVFKKVLRNGATGVFQGKILVKQSAQKTDGYQISQSLLLDGISQFLAKPELEIYADDVKCSHGSTSGAIDETALFYLQSRGVPKRVAQSLLVLAFLAEAVDEIAEPSVADLVRARLEDWLTQADH